MRRRQIQMRLCQPFFRALARSFGVAVLLGGPVVGLWLVAAAALADLIDARLGGVPLLRLLQPLSILSIAALGAMAVQHARDTLLQRRRVWLEHTLGEVVLAHELWLGSDSRHRTRSLAAVTSVARFMAGPATTLAEAPWAMAIIGGLWAVQVDIAAVASGSMLLVLAFALAGSRIKRSARQYDSAASADAAGQHVIHSAPLDCSLSMEQARGIAARWEETQRGRMAAAYAEGQARARRSSGAAVMKLLALMAFAAVIASDFADSTLSVGALIATALVAIAALHSLCRWVVDAGTVASARAAHRQLITLRIARARGGDAQRPAIAAPDLRAPLVAGFLATAATVAALAALTVYWQLPISSIMRGTQADAAPTAPAAQHTAKLRPLPSVTKGRT